MKGTGETVVRGGVGIYRYHDAAVLRQHARPGLRRPAASTTCCGTTCASWKAWAAATSSSAAGPSTRQRRQAAADLLLEPDPQPEAALVDEPRARLRRQQERPPDELGPRPIQRGAARRHARRSRTATQRLPAAPELRQPQRLPPQRVPELPRAPDAALRRQRGSFNFTAAYTFSKAWASRARTRTATGRTRRSTSSTRASTTTACSARTARTWRACRLACSCRTSSDGGVWQAAPRRLAARRRHELRERRPPAWAELQHAGHDRRGRGHQQPRPSRARPTSTPCRCSPATRGTTCPTATCSTPRASRRPRPAQNGNSSQPYIKGQPYNNHDLSLFKNFPIGGKGQKLQLRVSAYNVFNHPIRYPDTARNLTLRLRQRRADERRLREAARGQQVRPAHRPALRPVRVLTSGTRRSRSRGNDCLIPRSGVPGRRRGSDDSGSEIADSLGPGGSESLGTTRPRGVWNRRGSFPAGGRCRTRTALMPVLA